MLKFLKSLFAGGTSGQRYIVDGAALLDARNRGGRPSPADYVGLLKKVGSFAKKEQLAISVVVDCKPLREAGHGKEFSGVRVYYPKGNRSAREIMLQLARGTEAVVVTDDKDLERGALKAGAQVMRMSTFRKGLDGGGSGRNSGERNRGGEGEGNGQRRRRRRSGSGQNRSGGGERKRPAAEGGEKKPKEPAGDTISDLIDLV